MLLNGGPFSGERFGIPRSQEQVMRDTSLEFLTAKVNETHKLEIIEHHLLCVRPVSSI
jgi:hypothetical protein